MIELEHIQKVAGGITVVDIDALAVSAGQLAAVVGPAGSGKSTLLALLSGRTRPTAGSVRVMGLDPARDRDRLGQQIGVLFAENALYERLTARSNLVFHCRLRGLPSSRADETLSRVGLVDHAGVAAGRLPPGLARRLAFGRAILHQPAVLILVEPFTNCDAASRDLLTRLIRQLAHEGTAILRLTAEARRVAGLCQPRAELEQGRIGRTYSPEEGRRAELPLKIPARLEGKVELINPADILYASAGDGESRLHTAEGQVPIHFTLTELEERLARSGFFRAHRSFLVNLQRVKAVIPYTRDSFTLVLDDAAGTEIPLSKASARELRDLLGY